MVPGTVVDMVLAGGKVVPLVVLISVVVMVVTDGTVVLGDVVWA